MPRINLQEKLNDLRGNPTKSRIGTTIQTALTFASDRKQSFKLKKLYDTIETRMNKEGNEKEAEMFFSAKEVAQVLDLVDGNLPMFIQLETTRILDPDEYEELMKDEEEEDEPAD